MITRRCNKIIFGYINDHTLTNLLQYSEHIVNYACLSTCGNVKNNKL